MSSNFNCSYMARSSLTYVRGFSVKFFLTSKNFYQSPFSKWPPQYCTNSTLFDFNVLNWLPTLKNFYRSPFLANLAFRLLSSLFVRRPSVNISHFNLLLRNHWANCNQTLVEWSLMAPLENCVRWSRLPTQMASKLKIEKGRMKF